MSVEETCEVGVHSFITTDQLITESETGHKSTLFNPEDGTERPREKYSLNRRKCDQSLSKTFGALNPLKSPVSLLSYTRDVADGLE